MDERLQFADGRVIDEQKSSIVKCNYRISQTISAPKVIARVVFCGVTVMSITDDMGWNPPTTEQIKNLKETFNIDVILMEDKDDN